MPKYILGTIPFSGTNGFEAMGNMQAEEVCMMVDICLDAGINMFDTANLYSKGDAEKVLDAAIQDRRVELLITSKTGFPLGDNPNAVGASRINLEKSFDESSQTLGHRLCGCLFHPFMGGVIPVEETVATMTDLVKSGKIRYWGRVQL